MAIFLIFFFFYQIVAMNEGQFPNDGYPSSICGKTLTVTGPTGKTATATVVSHYPYFIGQFEAQRGCFRPIFALWEEVTATTVTWI